MEWPKLKNIIILILALVNLFLLAMVGIQERGAAQYQEQALADTISVLERNGIRVDSSNIPAELGLSAMSVERDLESEAILAAALLGACESNDLGSGRYAYQGYLGTAEFRSNGNFSFVFFDGVLNWSGKETACALAAMEKGGFTAYVVSSEVDGDQLSMILCQTWKGLPVYSCQVTLLFENGCLKSIVGQRLMGTPQSENDNTELISVPTALLRVLNGINSMGDICNEITAMTPGYLLNEGTMLIPMWHVTTDTGEYNLNALTGVLERA